MDPITDKTAALADQPYHHATIDQLTTFGAFPWPRALVQGICISHSQQPDGDMHFRLGDYDLNSEAANVAVWPFLVCEIVPQHPLALPPLHTRLNVWGMPRLDLREGWHELHPVFWWEIAA